VVLGQLLADADHHQQDQAAHREPRQHRAEHEDHHVERVHQGVPPSGQAADKTGRPGLGRRGPLGDDLDAQGGHRHLVREPVPLGDQGVQLRLTGGELGLDLDEVSGAVGVGQELAQPVGRGAERLDPGVEVLSGAGDVHRLDVPVAYLAELVEGVQRGRDPVGWDSERHRRAARVVVGRGLFVARLDAAAGLLHEVGDLLGRLERVFHGESRAAGGDQLAVDRLLGGVGEADGARRVGCRVVGPGFGPDDLAAPGPAVPRFRAAGIPCATTRASREGDHERAPDDRCKESLDESARGRARVPPGWPAALHGMSVGARRGRIGAHLRTVIPL
jgi:hypothetical protein